MKVCENCGAPMKPEATKCEYCGSYCGKDCFEERNHEIELDLQAVQAMIDNERQTAFLINQLTSKK